MAYHSLVQKKEMQAPIIQWSWYMVAREVYKALVAE